jgi:hypothetical protein
MRLAGPVDVAWSSSKEGDCTPAGTAVKALSAGVKSSPKIGRRVRAFFTTKRGRERTKIVQEFFIFGLRGAWKTCSPLSPLGSKSASEARRAAKRLLRQWAKFQIPSTKFQTKQTNHPIPKRGNVCESSAFGFRILRFRWDSGFGIWNFRPSGC